MPRKAREKSSTGIYHVIMRGVNRCSIFRDDEDSQKFISTLIHYSRECGFLLFAYCLMGNHVHLLIREGKESLGLSLKRINTSYVSWFNRKHERCGHLFQDRYKSEIVEDDAYFLTVLRYIHQNPIKAGLVENLADYHWSSYLLYFREVNYIEKDIVLKMFNSDMGAAKVSFEAFHQVDELQKCLDVNNTRKISDSEALRLIKKLSGVSDCRELMNIDNNKRLEIIDSLVGQGLSLLQISRITGIGRWTIYNAVNKGQINKVGVKVALK